MEERITDNEFITVVKSEDKVTYKVKTDYTCELCSGMETKVFGFWIEFTDKLVYLRSGDLWGGLYLRISYCPVCGRELKPISRE